MSELATWRLIDEVYVLVGWRRDAFFHLCATVTASCGHGLPLQRFVSECVFSRLFIWSLIVVRNMARSVIEVALASLCSSWSTTLGTRFTTVVQIVRDVDSANAHVYRYFLVVGICANPEPKVVRTVCGANTFAKHKFGFLSMVSGCCRCGALVLGLFC